MVEVTLVSGAHVEMWKVGDVSPTGMSSALLRPPLHLENYVVREENLKIAEKQFVRACEDGEQGRQP